MPTLSTPIAVYPVCPSSSLQASGDKCTEMERKLVEQYGADIPQLRKSLAGVERLEGVEYDEHGIPIGCTVMEWFDALDQKLTKHFGEEYRRLANERRAEWSENGPWKFDVL